MEIKSYCILQEIIVKIRHGESIKMKKYLFLVLMLSSFFSYSQIKVEKQKSNTTVLKGKVSVPKGKSIPEEGVHITILFEDKHYFSNQEGNYEFKGLKKNSRYVVRVLAYGFKPSEFEIITSSNTSTIINIDYEMNCEFTSKRALKDWKEGNAKLLLSSGLVSYVDPKRDSIFKSKYNVEYFDFGCNGPNGRCLDDYNSKIFKLLDKKYGKKWRKDIRKYLID